MHVTFGSDAAVNRVEEIKFTIHLDAKTALENKPLVNAFMRLADRGRQVDDYDLEDGDSLRLHYSFYADYVGQVAHALELVEQLADKGIITRAKTEELNYGRCLFADVAAKLNRIQGKVS